MPLAGNWRRPSASTFSDADPVSIHTLTSAGYQLLADVNRARSGSPMLKEAIQKWFKPTDEREARRRLAEIDARDEADAHNRRNTPDPQYHGCSGG